MLYDKDHKARVSVAYKSAVAQKNAEPQDHVNFLLTLFPDAGKIIEQVIRQLSNEWPKWCFMPLVYWGEIVKMYAEHMKFFHDLTQRHLTDLTCHLAATVTWRYCKGIYKFDDTLFEELTATDFLGTLPTSVFYNSPEWSIYIDLDKRIQWGQIPIKGIFMFLTINVSTNEHEIGFLLNDGTLAPIMSSLGINGDETIDDSYNKKIRGYSDAVGPEGGVKDENALNDRAFLKKVMPLILYICSDEPEIDDLRQPGVGVKHPTLTKTKKGFRLFEAPKQRIWTIGKKLGEGIRQGRLVKGYHAKSPHLRRAHWHGFWTGPRDSDLRKFKYKWLPPIFIEGSKQKDTVNE